MLGKIYLKNIALVMILNVIHIKPKYSFGFHLICFVISMSMLTFTILDKVNLFVHTLWTADSLTSHITR
jgi:hypothetical protein